MSLACGKVQYQERADAINAIEGFKRDKRDGHRQAKHPSSVYFCDGCKAWHITTQGKRVTRRKTTVKESDSGKFKERKVQDKKSFLVIRNFSSKKI